MKTKVQMGVLPTKNTSLVLLVLAVSLCSTAVGDKVLATEKNTAIGVTGTGSASFQIGLSPSISAP